MRAGLPISLLLHSGVLFGATIAFSTVDPLEQGRVVPVEMITVAEFTDIRESLKRTKPSPPAPDPQPMLVKEAAENAPDAADTTKIAPDQEVTAERPTPPALTS